MLLETEDQKEGVVCLECLDPLEDQVELVLLEPQENLEKMANPVVR